MGHNYPKCGPLRTRLGNKNTVYPETTMIFSQFYSEFSLKLWHELCNGKRQEKRP